MTLEDKLYLNGYKTDEIGGSHLAIKDEKVCATCALKQCLYVCACSVYELNENTHKVEINYDACLECGTCRIACDNIEWSYPRGGFGIAYKFG
ncbi:MAG: 4Fe-4S dicluster domain-containing protein [Bacteroidales bacterium]|nr:4Fe-4S dicluster domain-containing protein [Bacteroidales bacterium]